MLSDRLAPSFYAGLRGMQIASRKGEEACQGGPVLCHVMASHAMPGHIFACHVLFLRVMPCHEYSMPCHVKTFLGTSFFNIKSGYMGENYFQEFGSLCLTCPQLVGTWVQNIFRNLVKNICPSSAKSICYFSVCH